MQSKTSHKLLAQPSDTYFGIYLFFFLKSCFFGLASASETHPHRSPRVRLMQDDLHPHFQYIPELSSEVVFIVTVFKLRQLRLLV